MNELIERLQKFRAAREQAFPGSARMDYSAARPGRFRKVVHGMHGPADAHVANEQDLLVIREYVREFDRNHPIVPRILRCAVEHVVRGGIFPEPTTTSEELNRALWTEFMAYATDPRRCDIAGERTLAEHQQIAMYSCLRDGDYFWHMPLDDGDVKIEAFEADQCRRPFRSTKAPLGIRLGRRREVVSYYFAPWATEQILRTPRLSEMAELRPYDELGRAVVQLMKPSRVTQTRGMSVLTPLVDVASMFDDVNFALILKLQLAASAAFAVETQIGGDATATAFGDQQSRRGRSTKEESVEPGAILRLPPGQSIKVLNPQMPAAESLQYMQLLMQLVCIQAGTPLQVVLLDPTKTNFSGWRGALEQAKICWRDWQRCMVARVLTPHYERVVRAMQQRGGALGRMIRSAGEGAMMVRFQLPTWTSIQPLDDADANEQKLSSLQASPRSIAMEEGGLDYDDVRAELIEDNKETIRQALSAAKELNETFDAGVTWKDVLNPRGGAVRERRPVVESETEKDSREESAEPAGN